MPRTGPVHLQGKYFISYVNHASLACHPAAGSLKQQSAEPPARFWVDEGSKERVCFDAHTHHGTALLCVFYHKQLREAEPRESIGIVLCIPWLYLLLGAP